VTDWPVRENWKCANMETPKVPKPEEPKRWGMMMSPRGDVDPGIPKVTWLANVTWDDVDTYDVCHVSVSFEHMEY
jgi:hypothetical protein